MAFFEDEPITGPAYDIVREEFADSCLMTSAGTIRDAADCDPVLGMVFAEYPTAEGLEGGYMYPGVLVCNGPREMTDPERAYAGMLRGKACAAGKVCDLAVRLQIPDREN